ncbi:hypothetical protein M8C21_024212 [Ambrosia artemisiifolia]|uniref:Uncharacterized protein n=1 Tax=Ambrosia artemisiifolia TaxID=4212 RepID=A0AAD5G9V9_AMBAR|nr:hypothetical protein M8C21_024212 [Ambrosia artemisiifolia]
MVGSVAWGYVRIMAGTIVGGSLGFYVMHRLELSYKKKNGEIGGMGIHSDHGRDNLRRWSRFLRYAPP